MSVPLRIEGLLAKIESAYGTDPTPTVGSDAVRVSDRLWNLMTPDYAWQNTRENVHTGTVIPATPAVPRGRMMTFDYGVEFKGSRSGGAFSAGNKAEDSPLIRACGWTEVVDTTGGAEKITYTIADQSHDSCTVWGYSGIKLFKVNGVRGSLAWPILPGILGTFRYRQSGLFVIDPTETALPGGFTYATPTPLAGVGLALAIGAWSPDVVSAEFNQNGNIQRIDSANSTDGIQSFDWPDLGVGPTFRVAAKVVPLSTYDPYTDLKARTSRALTLQYGTVQYNKRKLTCNVVPQTIRHVDQNGFNGWDITYICDATTTITLL